ncbi:MFS transporter [Oceanicola sp. 502str15]|uniref:MFS transporter n=1 Tax=Oceanicola sp. 502str15 TaxID=2696061 RepID=UPI0020946816|nr:MFS transporter [Oceanicola sp. 502str15]MCO6383410.1 MFS transporter [Oceanicola sp. 502str15]
MSLAPAIRLSRRTLPAFATVGIFWGAFAAYTPQLKAGIEADDGTWGLVLLGAAVGSISAMWLAPRFDARFGRAAMALGCVLLGLLFQAPIWASTTLVFTAAMVLAGGAAGLLDVVMNARLSSIEAKTGASLMNLNHATFSLAYGSSALIAGLLRDGGTAPALTFAGLGLLAFGFGALARQRELPPPVKGEATPARVALPRVALWGGLIILLAFLAEQATEAWSALHIERTLGGGAAEGAIGPAMLGFTMCAGRLAGQFATARISEARLTTLAALVTAAGALLAALAPTPLVAYAGFGILGLGVSVIAPMVFALAGRLSPAELRPAVISRAAVIGYTGFFIGPPLLGAISELAGLRMAFVAVALCVALAPLLLLPIRAAAKATEA